MQVVDCVYAYLILKISYTLETVEFILGKRYHRVPLYHIAHHATLPLLVWMSTNYFPGGIYLIIYLHLDCNSSIVNKYHIFYSRSFHIFYSRQFNHARISYGILCGHDIIPKIEEMQKHNLVEICFQLDASKKKMRSLPYDLRYAFELVACAICDHHYSRWTTVFLESMSRSTLHLISRHRLWNNNVRLIHPWVFL